MPNPVRIGIVVKATIDTANRSMKSGRWEAVELDDDMAMVPIGRLVSARR